MVRSVVGVVLEPVPQPRPGVGERLVRNLDTRLVGADQSRSFEHREHTVACGVVMERLHGQRATYRTAVRAQGHEPQQRRAAEHALRGRHPLVEPVCRLGDGAGQATGRLVARDGERRPFATEPRLDEGVRHEGERTGLPGGVSQDQFGETRLQPEAGQAGRTFDRLTEPVHPDRWYEMNALDERPIRGAGAERSRRGNRFER